MTPTPHTLGGYDVLCPHCRKPLPDRGNKRRAIPRMGGKVRLVHAEPCAAELDRQQRLGLEAGGRLA